MLELTLFEMLVGCFVCALGFLGEFLWALGSAGFALGAELG